jgi:hypothetical protein
MCGEEYLEMCVQHWFHAAHLLVPPSHGRYPATPQSTERVSWYVSELSPRLCAFPAVFLLCLSYDRVGTRICLLLLSLLQVLLGPGRSADSIKRKRGHGGRKRGDGGNLGPCKAATTAHHDPKLAFASA